MIRVWIAATLMLFTLAAGAEDKGTRAHAIAMFGDVKYGPGFTHFDYVNPEAPKGGEVRMAVSRGSFDNLNSFILKGQSAAGLGATGGMIYNNLLQGSSDEAFTMYGELAEFIECPEDRSWVIFGLRPEARWHDGQPVTAADVVFTFETIMSKGHPGLRSYWGSVKGAEALDERRVKFVFEDATNRELPLIIGQMAVIPKHYWQGRDFEATTLEPPLGSGPYRIKEVDAGRAIVYERVKDYWGKDIPTEKGQHNFDIVRFDYYRDANVAIEALKAGQYDFRAENISKEWATAYDIPALKEGRLTKELVEQENGTGMQAFWFNMRQPMFADKRVRQALTYAFDFEWTNANLFYGQYTRTTSYFSNTELASSGLPQGRELEILEAYRGRVPEEVFTQSYEPPSYDGSGNIRTGLRQGLKLLDAAGWKVDPATKKLVHAQTGEPMEIEILLVSPSFERVVNPFVKNLERLGVVAKARIVDTSQYQNRVQDFDYDMIVGGIGQSLSPGNEQRDYWTTHAADEKGSRNFGGIKDPVIDELVEKVVGAADRETLVAATRALDRVLLWGHYVVPHWHMRAARLVYWNKFGKPAVQAKYAVGFPNVWWYDAAKAARLQQK